MNSAQTGKVSSAYSRKSGFTLIELLVVVAIIALLISILLPSLSAAREQAKASKCGANLHHVSEAMMGYLAESKGTFPLSYMYASDPSGGEDIRNQSPNHAYGYIHWSYKLYEGGRVADQAFQCPSFASNGGCPRTNPGPNDQNWEQDQFDDQTLGMPSPGASRVEDRQATRMAYTMNAAIVPRNKMGNIPGECAQIRQNVFVRDNQIEEPGRVVLATEFNRNWKATAVSEGSGYKSKAHRPLNPFYSEANGYCEYGIDMAFQDPFRYYPSSSDANYGLLSLSTFEERQGTVDDPTVSDMNCVGRHHPGGDKLGGTANFLYVDGHVARKTILSTLAYREWGKAYYGLNGPNRINLTLGYEYLPK